MNFWDTVWTVAVWIFWIAIFLAAVTAMIAAFFADGLPVLARVLMFAGGLVVAILLIAWCVQIINSGEDNASHCGPGTQYISHTYMVGKVLITDWGCVVPK